MANTVFSSAQSTVRNWWISLVIGVLYIIAGVWVFQTPLTSYVSLSIVFSVFIFVSGISQILFSITNKKDIDNWGWYLASGILDLIVGLLLISHPLMTMAILPYYVGFWLLFQAFMAIGLSFQFKAIEVPNWGWLLCLGFLTLVFAFLLLANPVFAGLSIVYMTAMAFVSAGIFRIFLAFGLRKIKNDFS
ncbi:HdeD family acid-resistance protein [Winogradskyella helgolandensis]|uniref:HdeD family acid-resistance protein n=1 Tax=Winogradskyella helgolandensis TaxID=2697010 RepID=UPI0015CAD3A8|nr:HdeD family acid-resistance protein [Winogradskyella helgolandensis]